MLLAAVASLALFGAPSCKQDEAPRATSASSTLSALPRDAPEQLRASCDQLLLRARRQPERADAWVQLGLLLEANAFWLQAAEAFEAAEALAPQDPLLGLHAAYARWQIDPAGADAPALLARAQRHTRSSPWKQFVGDVLIERGELRSARELFEAAAALAPERPEPLVGLGECELEEERPERAHAHLEAALALDPNYKAARYLLGVALQRCGRDDEAQRELTRGAGGRKRRMPDRLTRSLEPLALDFERVLGAAAEWIESGRAAQAEALLRQHAQRNGDDPRLGVNLGVARMRQGDPQGALEWFDAALRLAPDSHFAHINRSACLADLRRLDEALAAAQAAVTAAPGATRSHLALAKAHAARGEYEDAARAAQQAVTLEPRDPAARQVLAQALLALREDQRALTHLEAQRDLLPYLWQTHADLARAYALTGSLPRAQSALDQALELAPNEPRLRELAVALGLEKR